ncbi:MAG: hypothetical protein H7Y43_03945 [Akkermansiaceae bacterium]|nr:hypothetical protein [Verrucomicrobiales bacterium]
MKDAITLCPPAPVKPGGRVIGGAVSLGNVLKFLTIPSTNKSVEGLFKNLKTQSSTEIEIEK